MADVKPFRIETDLGGFLPKLKEQFRKLGIGEDMLESEDGKARIKVGLALLYFVVNGSPVEKVVPPIKFGILRGSGSVFVGSVCVGDTKMQAGGGQGTPATSHSERPGVITIGFNTAYAARLHETDWTPGGEIPSKQATNNPGILADVGNKFVQKHIQADGKILLETYAKIMRKAFSGK